MTKNNLVIVILDFGSCVKNPVDQLFLYFFFGHTCFKLNCDLITRLNDGHPSIKEPT